MNTITANSRRRQDPKQKPKPNAKDAPPNGQPDNAPPLPVNQPLDIATLTPTNAARLVLRRDVVSAISDAQRLRELTRAIRWMVGPEHDGLLSRIILDSRTLFAREIEKKELFVLMDAFVDDGPRDKLAASLIYDTKMGPAIVKNGHLWDFLDQVRDEDRTLDQLFRRWSALMIESLEVDEIDRLMKRSPDPGRIAYRGGYLISAVRSKKETAIQEKCDQIRRVVFGGGNQQLAVTLLLDDLTQLAQLPDSNQEKMQQSLEKLVTLKPEAGSQRRLRDLVESSDEISRFFMDEKPMRWLIDSLALRPTTTVQHFYEMQRLMRSTRFQKMLLREDPQPLDRLMQLLADLDDDPDFNVLNHLVRYLWTRQSEGRTPERMQQLFQRCIKFATLNADDAATTSVIKGLGQNYYLANEL
ncbi:MAG: hypothetical protein AAFN70_16225, partial [Planctomycetota bacterium]